MKKRKYELPLNLQLFAEDNTETGNEGTENKTAAPEIDYDKIINGVVEKLNEGKVEKKEDNQTETKIPEDKVNKLNEDYFNKAIEFETKYNKKDKEYNDLLVKNAELQKTIDEQNAKLQEYSTFGKTSDEIQENSRKLKTVDKNLSGLRRL